jgi:hypothetical protein
MGSVTFVPLTTSTSGASFLIAWTSASSFRSGWKEISRKQRKGNGRLAFVHQTFEFLCPAQPTDEVNSFISPDVFDPQNRIEQAILKNAYIELRDGAGWQRGCR